MVGKFSFVTDVDNFSLMFQNKILGLTESFWSYETNVFLQRMYFTPSCMCLSERTLRATEHPRFTWFIQPCVAACPLSSCTLGFKVQGPLRCARGQFRPQCPNIYCPASAGCRVLRKAVACLLTLGYIICIEQYHRLQALWGIKEIHYTNI